jgi:hypothetical protein
MHSPWYPSRSVTVLCLVRPLIRFSTGELRLRKISARVDNVYSDDTML